MLDLAAGAEGPIRTQIVRAALARVRAAGSEPRRLIERFQLPVGAETDPDVVVPLRTLHALLDEAERLTRDPFLGLHMAQSFPRGLFGIVEFIARNCATVREGLHRIVQYSSLMTNRVAVTFEERGGPAQGMGPGMGPGMGIIEHRIPGEPLASGRHANEFFVCAIVLQARELSGARFAPARVSFAHPRPADIGELVLQLGTSAIEFGAGKNRLELPGAVLELPIRSADPALLSVLDREAAHDLALRPTPRAFMDEVRAAIEAQLAHSAPSLQAIARIVGTSERTLQRRLGEDGRSFRDVVDEVREKLARTYLNELGLSLGEVAYRLGYAEVSAFLRAFKRWTGLTPSQFRAAS